MLHCSKSQLFLLVVTVAVFYVLVQFVFVFYSASPAGSLAHHAVNPRFRYFDDKLLDTGIGDGGALSNNRDSKQAVASFVSVAPKPRIEIQIPLDEHGRPFVFDQLPFFHRNNRFNYSVVVVREPRVIDVALRVGDDSGRTFVNIETENRLIDQKKLRLYTMERVALTTVRGIDKRKRDQYEPVEDISGSRMFKCLNSNQKVFYENFNDNYCDCIDGTDEPGTSACQFAQFFCDTQNEYLPNNAIPSSRVDDLICDCCDGSDESSRKCEDKCAQRIEEAKRQVDHRRKALALKRKYLVDGIFKNEQMFGPKGVFFKLSTVCFNIVWTEYTFELCPYKSVSQYKTHNRSWKNNLGSRSSLALVDTRSGDKKWLLKMEGGDVTACSFPRSSRVYFECGLEDALTQVQEPEKCVYEFKLLTPAAC